MSNDTRPCEICKKPIPLDRLETVPETRLCKEHALKIQKYGGEFTVTAKQERTSKPESFKPNYGSVSTSRKRNYEALEKLRQDYNQEEIEQKE